MTIDDLKDCYIEGRDKSNKARVIIDHKEPLVTEITKIGLKADTKTRRPFVRLDGIKSTNSVTLVTNSRLQSNWKLYNNVLPQVPVDRGQDITSNIREGTKGERVTAKMRSPGSKRKQISSDATETNPKVLVSQSKYRNKFIKKGNLAYFLKYQLQIKI